MQIWIHFCDGSFMQTEVIDPQLEEIMVKIALGMDRGEVDSYFLLNEDRAYRVTNLRPVNKSARTHGGPRIWQDYLPGVR